MSVNERNSASSGLSATGRRMRQIEKDFGDLAMRRCKDMSQAQLTKECNRLVDEYHQLESRLKALPYASGADSVEHFRANGGAAAKTIGDFDPASQANPKVALKKWRAPSAHDMSTPQMKSLFEAGRSGMRFKTHVGVETKDAGSWLGNVETKDWTTPVALGEGAPGSLLPPELIPQAWWLRYEPTRLIEFFPQTQGES